jgi:hypothetical protein
LSALNLGKTFVVSVFGSIPVVRLAPTAGQIKGEVKPPGVSVPHTRHLARQLGGARAASRIDALDKHGLEETESGQPECPIGSAHAVAGHLPNGRRVS